jgi:ribosomal protein S27AE
MSAYFVWNDWFGDKQLEWMLFAIVPLVLIWLNHLILYRLLKPKYHKVTDEVIEPSIFTKMIDKQVERIGENFQGDTRKAARNIVINRIVLRNHIIIYALVNSYLFYLNIRSGIRSPWFLWPALTWGMTILFHTFGYLNYKRKTLGEQLTKKYLLVYPSTLSIYLIITDYLSNKSFDWFWWVIVPIIVLSLIIAQIVSRKKLKNTENGTPQTEDVKDSSRLGQKSDNVHVQRIQRASKRFCPKCGKPILAHHRFCQSCGYELESE